MKKLFNFWLFLGFAFTLSFLLGVSPARAVTPNIPLTAQEMVIPIQLSGTYTATSVAVAKFKLPFRAYVLGVSATAQSSAGTTPTLTVDVLDAGTSILSAPLAVTAGAVTEGNVAAGNLATPELPDESLVSVNLAIGGSGETLGFNNITVLITLARR